MKDRIITPTRTSAIVVGIEKYTLGSGPGIDLDGPAHDAYRFADWLVSRGVPQENIALLLSPLESNNSSLGEWSMSSQWPATRKGVSDVITQWLPKQTGDLLWVFWGGHGVMTATRSRRLFYADTTTADWCHLDLESLLIRFSSDNLPSFQQQIYLIDTCANYRRQLSQERLGDGDRFAPGEPVRGREQFVFFATQEGEVAKNLSQEQTGLFSKMVLEELAKEPSRSWPPDMEKLAARVRESFSDPAKAGKTKQVPIFASYRTWDGTEYFFGQQAEQAPAIWNVPYQRNLFFVGREAVFQSLRQTLVPGAKTTALTQSIGGLGGIGKTQVAVEYAHRYAQDYEAVLWLQADSWETLTAACLQFAVKELGLPEQQKAEEQIAEVKRWLQKRDGWLLILDNAEDPQAILSTFVPSKHQGSVLITTRRRDVGVLAHSEMLPLFSEEEAVLFLLRRAKCIANEAEVTEATTDDFFLARDLCQLLDRLPLALDQAGAYIAENGSSLQRYIDLYHQHRRDILYRRNADDQSGRRNGSDHPDSVLMTFWLSWDQIQQRNILAGKALQFCAFLAPDQIPEQLVVAGVLLSENEAAVNDLEMDEALGLLHNYSLVKREKQTLSLHRLVQGVLQEVLSEEGQQQWMEQAVLVVNAVFPSGEEHGTWPLCEFLLPHALMCAKWIKDLRQKKLEGAQLLSDTGRYLHERARYGEAEPLYQLALLIFEEQLGASHTQTATGLSHLALLYQSQGKYAEAVPLYQRALQISEQSLGPEHPEVASTLNNLATVLYREQGKYAEAELLYQRALQIREQSLGPENPRVFSTLNNLAVLYRDQGKYAEAELLYQRALQISEQSLGPEHPRVALTLICKSSRRNVACEMNAFKDRLNAYPAFP